MPVRPAIASDVPDILAMIHELAEYERAPEAVVASVDDLRAALFGAQPAAFALVAEPARDSTEGARGPAGFALWFLSYSTWTGRHGIHLEDLYVRDEHRGHGHGRDLLAALAAICQELGYRRLEWAVLDWNEPAIGFYRGGGRTGARRLVDVAARGS
jgi:ribosomal protein S18 acetylase RimI-like enzyme